MASHPSSPLRAEHVAAEPALTGAYARVHRFDGVPLIVGRRTEPDKALNPTRRDIELLRALWAYRFLTTDQVWRLWWPHAKLRRAQRRLGWLFHTGYVDRFRPRLRHGSFPWTYSLARRGHELLVMTGAIPRERYRPIAHADFTRVVHDLQTNAWVIAYRTLLGARLVEWQGPEEATLEPPAHVRREAKEPWGRPGLSLHEPRRVVPDAGLLVSLPDDRLAALLVEFDRTGRPDKNHQKFLRYDALLSWWWVDTDLGMAGATPLVVFVCQDYAQLRRFAIAADAALTAKSVLNGREHPGRQRICFALERDVHEGRLDALQVPSIPPDERKATADPRRIQLPGGW